MNRRYSKRLFSVFLVAGVVGLSCANSDDEEVREETSLLRIAHKELRNGINWNGINWNGINWNGINWNGINWNGINWATLDGARLDTSGIPDDWSGLGWFIREQHNHENPNTTAGAYVVTNPSVRHWIHHAPDAYRRELRLYALGKLIEGSACPGWRVVFGEVDGQRLEWRGRHCLAPGLWGHGPVDVQQERAVSAYMIALFNDRSLAVSLRAPMPTLTTTRTERKSFPVAQACFVGNLFSDPPQARAFAIHDPSTIDAISARQCRPSFEQLQRQPNLAVDGDASLVDDACSIRWANATQHVLLAEGDGGFSSLARCESPNAHGDIETCRMFTFERRSHAKMGPIEVASSVESYPTVCVYLPAEHETRSVHRRDARP